MQEHKLITYMLGIVQPPPPPFFLKGGGVNFNYLPGPGGGSEKLKMGVEVWCRGRGVFKGWGETGGVPGGGGALSLFNFFIKVYLFYI